jgi:tRNA nucleotidyltransferase (CCA-adding enzyme)
MNAYLDRTDHFMRALGIEAYRVGGSVRDELLGRRVKDADYMVRNVPLPDLEDILAERRHVCNIKMSPLKLRDGRRVGVRVSGRGLGLIEIVLPRTEISTGPGHGDFEIVADPRLTLDDDARRRDFTFNALYLRLADGEILDPTGRGKFDLMHRQINVTHADSFRDDPLRTLRALRFISTLGYELGVETRALMALHADAVTGLSAKGYASGTVLEELSKLLMGQNPATALRVARDTGVLAVAFPELAPMIGFEQASRYHDMTTDEHVFTALETAAHVDAPLRVRMALLFHDAGKPEAAWVGKDGRKHYYATPDGSTEDHEVVGARIWDEAAGRLGAERKLRNDVRTLILNHMVPCITADPVRVRRERVRLGDEMLRDLYLMRMCDLSGKGDKNTKFLDNVGSLERIRRQAETDGVPASVRDLEIDGRDAHDALPPHADHKLIGDVLRGVLDEVVVDPSEQKRTREWQMRAAARLARKS